MDIPTQVFAGDAHAAVAAVMAQDIVVMPEGDLAARGDSGGGLADTVTEISANLGQEPRAAVGTTADHHAIGTRCR